MRAVRIIGEKTELRNWLPVIAATGAFAAILLNPGFAAAALAGTALVIVVLRKPIVAVYVLLTGSGFGLLGVMGGLDPSIVSTGSSVFVLLGLLSVMLRAQFWRWRWTVALATGMALVTAIGLTVAAYNIPLAQGVQGARILFVPLSCAVIARFSGEEEAKRLLRFATVIVVSSLAAALVEHALGLSRLTAMGLEYGTVVRSANGEFRAPGLFTRNFEYGAFAGVVGALALTWWPSIERTPQAKIWRGVAVAASIASLVLSWYRGGLLVFFVAVGLWVLCDARVNQVGRKIGAVLGCAGLMVFLLIRGLTSPESLGMRVEIWEAVLERHPFRPLGYGLGYSGAASGSRFADTPVVIDNYFINATIQLGLVGLIMMLAILWVAIVMFRRRHSDQRFIVATTLIAVLSAFSIVDFWEYSAAMSLALSAVAITWSASTSKRQTRKQDLLLLVAAN